MTERPELPYEKAIEETAKAAGKALDVVKSMSPAVADAFGLLIGDHIAALRERNLDAITRKTKKIIEERNLKDEQPIPEQIGIRLLEEAKGESREAIQDLYAALLANAMDPSFADDVRPEFIDTVKQLQPVDALVIQFARRAYDSSAQVFQHHHVHEHLNSYRSTAIEVRIDHLLTLKCLKEHPQGFILSPFGLEFIVACDPHI